MRCFHHFRSLNRIIHLSSTQQKIKKRVDAGINSGAAERIRTSWISRQLNDLTIKLVENPDILKEISAMCKNSSISNLPLHSPLIVGFCAESENLIENAKIKIQNKGCDYIVANDISRKDIGFNSDENEVYIIDKTLNIKHIEKDTKYNIARKILENIFEQV